MERAFDVGFSRTKIADPMGGDMGYALWYPTEAPNGVVSLGPVEFPGSWDAEPAAGPFGLVVMSHGSGGSELGHVDTAVALAEAGFIVAAPRHPRNNALHDIHDDQRVVLDGRPVQFSAVIDALLAREPWSGLIAPGKIGAFGFSAGGYTVLTALGAERDYTRTLDHCEQHANEDPYCRVINGEGREDRVRDYAEPASQAHDGRLCAAVIVDPFTGPFSDEAIAALPPAKLLFFRPEIEDVIKAEFHASRVVRLLTQRDDFPTPLEIVAPGAKHLSFLAPALTPPDSSRSDPEGFDRAAYHETMNGTVVSFFREAFADCPGH